MKESSFLPEDYLDEKLQQRKNVIRLSLFVVVLSVVVGSYFYTDHQGAEINLRQTQVNSQFRVAAKRLEQFEELQARKAKMIRKAQITASLIESIPRSIIIAELINAMPSTMTLRELNLSTKTINVSTRSRTKLDKERAKLKSQEHTAPKIERTHVKIDLVGLAPTDIQVSEFMKELRHNELFHDVHVLLSEWAQIEKQAFRKFTIEMTLNQTVDMTQFKAKLVRREVQHNPMVKQVPVTGEGKVEMPRRGLARNPRKNWGFGKE